MCLAIPGQIDKLTNDQAEVVIGTNRYDVCTILTPEVRVGDWVLVHAGYSITSLDEQEARETYALIQQLQTELPSEEPIPPGAGG
jgi:hydrogenase expression/formation protein HypC